MKIPTLKFTVKQGCRALSQGPKTLETMKFTSRFGVKIVKIDKVRPGRTKGKKDVCPDRCSKLKPGDKVWILPHLSSPVPQSAEDKKDKEDKKDEKDKKDKKEEKDEKDKKDKKDKEERAFLNAYNAERIYTIDDKNRNAVICLQEAPAGDRDGHSGMERVLKADLRGFMEEFSLKDEDLELDMLPCCAEPFCKYQLETAASVCTVPFAQNRLEEEKDPQVLERLRSKKSGKVELLALNMRHNFRVSPVAVMHCGPNESLFEIPETVRTILYPNDCLVFLESDPGDINQSMQNLNKGILELEDHELEGGAVVREVKRVKEVRVPPPKTRRGKGKGGGTS